MYIAFILLIRKEFYIMKEYIEEKIKKLQERGDPKGYLSRLASTDTEIRRLWKAEVQKDNTC